MNRLNDLQNLGDSPDKKYEFNGDPTEFKNIDPDMKSPKGLAEEDDASFLKRLKQKYLNNEENKDDLNTNQVDQN
eukprot:CAMPEP_0176357684 /NCGR_PEP_ID=MMETSP0126-20121128/14970_1 /TAXON_ID=141414 ORGANISM="Strombidinopsis acuminatum, Strain SPMC142" /NCGR_SAMPLE_ID=MMETSP0126 /ASSEMBLY_ACC=CAM_ASM_000229 /LENGTH=74 /DNA_ID=CAMNT_0017711439 /DNA_START=176 /DNA_END=400 /DNA_ORIENTATION=+